MARRMLGGEEAGGAIKFPSVRKRIRGGVKKEEIGREEELPAKIR